MKRQRRSRPWCQIRRVLVRQFRVVHPFHEQSVKANHELRPDDIQTQFKMRVQAMKHVSWIRFLTFWALLLAFQAYQSSLANGAESLPAQYKQVEEHS